MKHSTEQRIHFLAVWN